MHINQSVISTFCHKKTNKTEHQSTQLILSAFPFTFFLPLSFVYIHSFMSYCLLSSFTLFDGVKSIQKQPGVHCLVVKNGGKIGSFVWNYLYKFIRPSWVSEVKVILRGRYVSQECVL